MKNLIKRIKNLWKISSFDIEQGTYDFKPNLKPKKRMATIIKTEDKINKFLNE